MCKGPEAKEELWVYGAEERKSSVTGPQRERKAVGLNVAGWLRSSNTGLLIRSLDFNLRAVAGSREHYGIHICILEEFLQLQCEG